MYRIWPRYQRISGNPPAGLLYDRTLGWGGGVRLEAQFSGKSLKTEEATGGYICRYTTGGLGLYKGVFKTRMHAYLHTVRKEVFFCECIRVHIALGRAFICITALLHKWMVRGRDPKRHRS
jgi:hypothetical protein